MEFKFDSEFQAHGKSPRSGCWNRCNGDLVLRCPTCGNTPKINAHTISDSGDVTPSVVCTTPGCTFHEFVKLDGFTKDTHE